MMGGGADSGMQVIYLEIEGIKIAYMITRDALKLAWQLAKFILASMKDAPYKKSIGRTNIKNVKTRAGGQALVACRLEEETYRRIAKDMKRAGLLYNVFRPLKSGKHGCVQILLSESDLAILQELLTQQKEQMVRENVKNGMSEEQAEQVFDENNRTESMEEFAENAGVNTPEEVYEAEMKERFGEDYEKQVIDFAKRKENYSPKGETAGVNRKKLDSLAEIINFQEYVRGRDNAKPTMQFFYDPRQGKSQIVEETETHIKVAGKGLGINGDLNRWESVWIPKDAVFPPLGREAGQDGLRSVYLPKDADVIVGDPLGREEPKTMKAEQAFYQPDWKTGRFAAEAGEALDGQPGREAERYDITIGKTYPGQESESKQAPAMIWDETEQAVKTRVPGTYGANVRFLWLDKKDIRDANNGKSILTSLEKDREYPLYSEDGKVAQSIRGEDLYREHYDPVKSGKQKMAAQSFAKGRGSR